MRTKIFKLALASLTIAAGLTPISAQAHHRAGHSGGPPHRGSQSETRDDLDAADSSYTALTTAQRTLLSELLRDTTHPDYVLIDGATRAEIESQIDSLPPGIQRRLARGRSLPPGIAKKVSLPSTLNERLDLDDDVDIIVIGPDVAVVDPITGLIIDILREVLL